MKKAVFFLIVLFFYLPMLKASVIDTNRVYGLTLDAVNNLAQIDTALARLCKKPTTRIVFDEFVAATDYTAAVNTIHNYSFIMGELLDSYYVKQYTLATYTARANEYLSTLGTKVDIWEIGNEINGEWLGTISDVVAKMDTAYSIFKAANKKTELTLYYNKDCWSNSKNEMFYWVNTNVKTKLRNGLDYVLVSYYEDDCNGLQPDWQKVFDSLHVLFPNAKLGIGECGTTTTSNKEAYITRYYKMNITTPNFVGGYFWWYFHQDCVPYTSALWTTFNNSISNCAAPTTQATQLKYSLLTTTSVSLNWTNGNGSKRMIFMKDGTGTVPNVADGFTYTGNNNFGSGTSDGGGWYCVYNGSAVLAPATTITGLLSGHNYLTMVIEYNGFSGFEGYNKNSASGNPVLVQGFLPITLYSFNGTVYKNNVTLKWITSTEENNKGFYIERNLSGADNWLQSGFVTGHGNSNTPITYSYNDANVTSGKYKYRLKQIDYNGNYSYHNLESEIVVGIPPKYELSQNYPNPFNPTTNIQFAIPKDERVTIKLFDISGREIKTLVNEDMKAGYNSVVFNASNFSSGIYFYRIGTNDFTDTKKMLLVK
ncbi:MAG: T9SS type A sorting domain-containing protein [Ignavibacteria bacterium]|nr:T9SS type A sorting domain-containing protein [Ignavibacteria bacterium]